MKRSHSILSNGHIFNSPRSIDPPDIGALNPKVKHSLILNSSRCTSSRNICDSIGTVPITPIISATQPCMDPGPSSKPAVVPSSYFASPIRTLKESLKDPGTHNISIHDLVEAYNSFSTKLRDRIHDITSTESKPSFLAVFENEAQLLSDCLMRDIGHVLPNPFASQHHYNDSLANLSFYPEDIPNDEDVQTLTENNLLCSYALRIVSDIFAFPTLHGNFTHNQLVSLFDYVLRLCKTKTSPIFNIQKHSAMALWILKVQQLSLSILLPLKKEIIVALRNSISHDLGGYVAKLDAFKAVRSILRRYPSSSSWLVELLPLILAHVNSDSPEISIHAAMACSGFASAKMDRSQEGSFPSDQASNYVKTYIAQETLRRAPSHNENVLFSFFKSAAENVPKWQQLGLSFVFTVLSCFIVLLDHHIFLNSSCIKFVVCVLRECRLRLRSVQEDAWGLLFWAYSRLPPELERDGKRGKLCTKERAFRVIIQDGRLGNLIALLLREGDGEVEGKRLDEDVSRAMKVLENLTRSEQEEAMHQAAMILARMMASIGSPSTPCSQADDLPFPRELIDDSILLQTKQNIKVPPVLIPIDRVPPLTEAQVLCHWEHLITAWISVAQRILNSGQQLSPEVVQTWQALLLVRGEILPGKEHLTASSSLSTQILSILKGFTAVLDTPEMQICYLSFIKKLWSVMKNVFAESFLSSPAESILAPLLKRSFTLADDRVKNLWSQLCGDLISVGVSTLLHALHSRHSESGEEQEVTRQLWTILAKKGPLVTDAESWEALLNFLVTPLGVWDLSDAELLNWERIIAQAVDSGERASRTRQDVISRLLSLCSEPRIQCLKQSPRILRSLLAQSSVSSDPCSPTNLQILSWIDDSLANSYHALEDRDYAISSLRLIGEVISNTTESDIVQLLSTVQKSLVQWIADEERRLEGDEDDELVDVLYMRSLDILARVEPSIAVLEQLTPFFTSVFVRIRGQGPLAFYNFWRATYHKRDDIPKSQIPLSIRQKLKSWADVTQSSIGDGIPFDSGSDSLQSDIIPDSQPMDFEDVDLIYQGYSLDPVVDPTTGLMITVHEYPALSSDDGEKTPVPLSSFIHPGVQDFSGIQALEDHGGRNNRDGSKVLLEDAHIQHQTPQSPRPIATSLKHSPDPDSPGSRTPKRRKIEVSSLDFKPRAGKERARDEDEALELHAKRNSPSKTPLPGPTAQIPTPFFHLQKSPSQPSQSRRSARQDRTSSKLEGHSRSFEARNPEEGPSSLSFLHDPPDQINANTRRTSEDYDSWERNVTSDEVNQVRAELQIGSSVAQGGEYQFDDVLKSDEDGEMTDDHKSDDDDFLSPSLGQYPVRSRVRQRSQTAPEQSLSLFPVPDSRALRRNQTTPVDGIGRKSVTSRAQVDVLQRAYAIVADTGASQVDVHDILEAKRVLNQINQVLDEQICSKLGPTDTHDV